VAGLICWVAGLICCVAWINLLGGCQVGCGAILGSTPTHIGDDGDEGVGDGEGQALRRA
jgi:hypothetical protein